MSSGAVPQRIKWLVNNREATRELYHRLNNEALGARLCRHEESFIYEISLLQPDGRIVKILFDANTGKPWSCLDQNP